MWSVGASVDTDSRVKFDAFFKDLMAGKNEEHPIPPIVGKIESPIPHEGLVYDYMFEVGLILARRPCLANQLFDVDSKKVE